MGGSKEKNNNKFSPLQNVLELYASRQIREIDIDLRSNFFID